MCWAGGGRGGGIRATETKTKHRKIKKDHFQNIEFYLNPQTDVFYILINLKNLMQNSVHKFL